METPPPTQSAFQPDSTTRRPKRRKIAVACDECRARKVRCDGIQPGTCSAPAPRLLLYYFRVTNAADNFAVCGPCAKREEYGVRCKYTGEPEKKRAVKKYGGLD
jgi:hypothetical protein